jgi:urease accessory protein
LTPPLGLLHLTDSLFPIGSFAHSDGLESATQSGAISTPRDLTDWLDVCLDETIGQLEGPVLLASSTAFGERAWERLVSLDQELTAMRPSSTARRASRVTGFRLLTNWRSLYPDPALNEVFALVDAGRLGPTLPVAFAVAATSIGVEKRAAAEAYAYSRLASTISAAMRLMPIGQTDAHALLADALKRVPAVVDALVDASAAGAAAPRSFSPAMDLATMRQQYLHSRLFLS